MIENVQTLERPSEPCVSEAPAHFVRSAFRTHALKVAQHLHKKHDRVSQEFIDDAVAAVESKMRSFLAEPAQAGALFGPVPEDVSFLTGAGKERLNELFNRWVANEIYRRVHAVRIGRTL
jgi:hypothetical protein